MTEPATVGVATAPLAIVAPPLRPRSLNLPDFCAARAVLAVVLIVTLTAVVLTVARQSTAIHFWLDLARTSLLLLWIGMGSAAVLCLLRHRLAEMPIPLASILALASVLAVIALISAMVFISGVKRSMS